jgi:hypothetical protein
MTHIPPKDVTGASEILQSMNGWSDAEIRHRQALGWQQLDKLFNWDRSAEQFEHALLCPLPARPASAEWQTRMIRNRQQLRQIIRHERRAEQVHAARSAVRRAVNRLRRAG